MSEVEFYTDGFDEFSGLLDKFERNVSKENLFSTLEYGAKEFAQDLRKLPKPRSEIQKGGYTHILDTMTTRRTPKDVEVGWGKYYGPMLEKGTRKMAARSHLRPLFERNKNKYYKMMTDKLFEDI